MISLHELDRTNREDDTTPRNTNDPDDNTTNEELVVVVMDSPSACNIRWSLLALVCALLFGIFFALDVPAALHSQLYEWMNHNNDNDNNDTTSTDKEDFEFHFQLLFTLYSIPNMVLPLIGGRWVDVWGPSRCLYLFAATCLLGQIIIGNGVNQHEWHWLWMGRFVYGMGGESLCAAYSTLLSRWFGNTKYLAFAFGMALATSRLGSVLNDWISPTIADTTSTSTAMWMGTVFTSLSVLCAILIWWIDQNYEAELNMTRTRGNDDEEEEEILRPPPSRQHLDENVISNDSPNLTEPLLMAEKTTPTPTVDVENAILDTTTTTEQDEDLWLLQQSPVPLSPSEFRNREVRALALKLAPTLKAAQNVLNQEDLSTENHPNHVSMDDDDDDSIVQEERALSVQQDLLAQELAVATVPPPSHTGFGILFWLLSLSCLVIYACILPWNNVASGILLERNLFQTPSTCHLQYPTECSNGTLQWHSNPPMQTDKSTGRDEACPYVGSHYAPVLPTSLNITNTTTGHVIYQNDNITAADVDCDDPFWSRDCTVDFCQALQTASEQAGKVMSIPYTMSAFLAPLLGQVIDRTGRRPLLALLASVLLIVVHATLAWTSTSPMLPLMGQGVAYALYSSVLWPSISLTVPKESTGMAYGVITSIQNFGLTVCPMVAAFVYERSSQHFLPNVELLFTGCAIVGTVVGILLWVVDHHTGGRLTSVDGKGYAHSYQVLTTRFDTGTTNVV